MTRAAELRLGRRKGSSVFDATFRGAPAVAKLMDATEFRVLTEAQGPGVVRVLHSAQRPTIGIGAGDCCVEHAAQEALA